MATPPQLAAPYSGTVLFRDGARVFLLRHHEDQNFQALVRAGVARSGMNCAGRLVKRVSGFQETRRLAIDRKLVCPLHDVSERVVAGVPMRWDGGSRCSVAEAHAA